MKKSISCIIMTVAALLSGACGTETLKAKWRSAKMDDERQARDIVNGAVAREVNCFHAATHAFNPDTGEAQVWTFRRDDGTLECYDSAGYHRTARSYLMKITTEEVAEILNTDYYRPAPPPPMDPPADMSPYRPQSQRWGKLQIVPIQ